MPIHIDGTLDDDAWRQAESASDFVQQDPQAGAPVSEATEVRVLVDDEAIYFGIDCHDADPRGVIARELRRDNPFAADDHFEILLDTFHDHRNAYHFAVNPLGTQYDALITDEGHDINAEWNERCQAGHLAGVEQMKTGLRLCVKPYAPGGFRDVGGGASELTRLSDVGSRPSGSASHRA